ncbi:hypothetical protein G3I76_24995, partial [Streptomyces sp. SID11233]|nr:hypothetical protein [Streptomyces sp. SID11233]
AAKGRCSARASLLDHSDALNKNEDDYDAVRGLSALGLLPREPGTAIAVADNEPGRYFTIRLGPADKLRVAVRGARALTKA